MLLSGAFLALECLIVVFGIFMGFRRGTGCALIRLIELILIAVGSLLLGRFVAGKLLEFVMPLVMEMAGDTVAQLGSAATQLEQLVSGLLGALIVPIFFAFFYVLQTAAELRGAEFLFWVTDLSQPDTVCHIFGLPLNILPFIMAASMVAMMKMSPSAGDPMQQKIMKFMPVMFFLFCYTYPSALALYWTTTNIISIIQTLIIRRLPQPTLEEAQANAKGKQKEGFFARIQRMAEEQQRALEEQKRNGGMRNVTKKKK